MCNTCGTTSPSVNLAVKVMRDTGKRLCRSWFSTHSAHNPAKSFKEPLNLNRLQFDNKSSPNKMCTVMNVAICHNNEGIALLEKGLHDKALLEFKKSAQLMYSITQDLKAKGPVVDPHTSATTCNTTNAPIVTGNYFIRSSPIVMSSSDELTAASCTVESATVLVNMALCYHLDSLLPNGIEDAIANAVTLYDMSYSLGLQINEDPRSHHIILTALNNLGQIHHDLGNFDKSRLYFENLSTYVILLGREGTEDTVSDRHEFMLNALVLRNPNTSAAAA
jgi:tetratricopeptide (TPR) repeat protein